jgi:hypothetical protein
MRTAKWGSYFLLGPKNKQVRNSPAGQAAGAAPVCGGLSTSLHSGVLRKKPVPQFPVSLLLKAQVQSLSLPYKITFGRFMPVTG